MGIHHWCKSDQAWRAVCAVWGSWSSPGGRAALSITDSNRYCSWTLFSNSHGWPLMWSRATSDALYHNRCSHVDQDRIRALGQAVFLSRIAIRCTHALRGARQPFAGRDQARACFDLRKSGTIYRAGFQPGVISCCKQILNLSCLLINHKHVTPPLSLSRYLGCYVEPW